MTDKNFSIGKRVKITKEIKGLPKSKGLTGKIINVIVEDDDSLNDENILVEFDRKIAGHDGNDVGEVTGKTDRCWWCDKSSISIVEKKK